MDNDFSQIFQHSPAVQLVRMRNAHWVIPFLFRVFKTENRHSIPESELTQLLAEELDQFDEDNADYEDARIQFGDDEHSRARKYLQSWVQKRILQDQPDQEGQTHYQLRSYTEKVFTWLKSLESRTFVGTESRFRYLYQTLKEIVEYSQDNTSRRLEDLKNRKAEIEKEIKRLEMGVQPEVFSNAQVKERLEMFSRHSYELLSDFREVEDNFKQIHRRIVEEHTKAEVNKGRIIGFAFEAYDELRKSDQGKSFYAFWDFLISRTGQEEWRELTDQLLALLQDREIETDQEFIQNIKSLLLQQGRNVYEANDKMAEKLSRIITEKELTRHRRLRQQISSIKELVFQLIDEGDIEAGIEIKESIPVKMHMERRLNLTEKQAVGTLKQPSDAEEKIVDMDRFSRFIQTSHVDRKKLWNNVETILTEKQTATLGEVVAQTGLEYGIAEIVAYYSFLKEKQKRSQIINGSFERIPINANQTQFLEVPYLLFSK